MKLYWVYILASDRNGTLYTGVTSDIARRVSEHKAKIVESFTKKYDIVKLVYAGEFEDADAAHAHEKRVKRWRRRWKLKLIEDINPDWNDLYDVINC